MKSFAETAELKSVPDDDGDGIWVGDPGEEQQLGLVTSDRGMADSGVVKEYRSGSVGRPVIAPLPVGCPTNHPVDLGRFVDVWRIDHSRTLKDQPDEHLVAEIQGSHRVPRDGILGGPDNRRVGVVGP